MSGNLLLDLFYALSARFNDGSAAVIAAVAALPAVVRFGFAAVIGLVFGSFLSVVVYRLPIMLQRNWERELHTLAGKIEPAETAAPRVSFNLCVPASNCTECGHPLRIWENLPLLSFVVLRGRCSACGAPIGWIYPALEAGCALLAMACLWHFGIAWQAVAAFGLGATLLALGTIDARTGLLPDAITLPLLWAGLLINLTSLFTSPASAIVGAAAGYVTLWAVYWLFRLATGKEGMGYGDFKLFAALGAWLGWQWLAPILSIAALAGACAGIAALALGRVERAQPLPFGPYLAAAALLVLFGADALYGLGL